MERICEVCGVIDELPREVVWCAAGEWTPSPLLVAAVSTDLDLADDVRTAALAALSDQTSIQRHLGDVTCNPFQKES